MENHRQSGGNVRKTNGSALRVRDLSYSYEAGGDPVVRVRRLDVAAGEQLVLTGQSGRGKSTLLHLLAGLMDPQLGEVVVAGQSLRTLTGSRRDRFRGRHIGMVFQTFHLLHGFTAVENVMAALMFSEIPKSDHRRRALELLDQLGIDRPMALAQELSVGQQQRVAVARAIACKPTVVLADEPTASLDPEHGRTAVRLLEESCREAGAALVCVTHDPSLVPMFDRHETLDALAGEAVGAGKGDA